MGVLKTKGDIAISKGGPGRLAAHAVPSVTGQTMIADPTSPDGWINDYPIDRREAALRPTGAIAETVSRAHGATSSLAATVSGTLYASGIIIPANRTITSITFMASSTALAGVTHQWFALVDNALNVLAKTVDDVGTAWAASTTKTLALSPGTFTTTYSGLYYLCSLIVATTMPTWIGFGDAATATGLIAPASCGSSTAGLTDPTSLGAVIAPLVSPGGKRIWGWVS